MAVLLDVPAGSRWFQGRVAPIADPGRLEKFCLLVRDITEQKAAEKARDQAEEQLRIKPCTTGSPVCRTACSFTIGSSTPSTWRSDTKS